LGIVPPYIMTKPKKGVKMTKGYYDKTKKGYYDKTKKGKNYTLHYDERIL